MKALLLTLLSFFTAASLAAESLDGIVASIDTEVITESELKLRTDSVRMQLTSQGQTPPKPGSSEHQALKKQVLNSLIDEKLQLLLAENYKITIEDQDVDQTIASIANQNNMTIDQLKQTISAEGYSFDRFEEDLRRDLLLSRLQQQLVSTRIQVNDQEVAEFLKTSKHLLTSNQEYHVGHILIALPENPSPAELQAAQRKVDTILEQLNNGASFSKMATTYSDSGTALKGGDLGWTKAGELPTLFAPVVPRLKVNESKGPLRNSSGLHIVKLIDVRGDESKKEVSQTHARHILIKTDELMNDSEAELRLNELRQRVLSGESFEALARTHSEDPGSSIKGGDLGWLDMNSNLDETFFKEMEKTETGKISPPFKSAFGWHIIEVIERRQQDQTKEYQENMARKMLQNSKFLETRQNWLNELRDTAHIQIRDPNLQDEESSE